MNDQAAKLRKLVDKRNAAQASNNQDNCKIITVASGKGGVGKSNITVNTGLALQKTGKKVLLIDGDLGMANLDILLGISPRYNLGHVLKEKCDLKQAILKSSHNLHVLPGFSGINKFINSDYKLVSGLLEISSYIENNYEVVLIDVGAGIDKNVINFIMAADETLIVLTPEPTSVMDAYSLIKTIADSNCKGKVGMIINKVGSDLEARKVVKRMKKVILKNLARCHIDFISNSTKICRWTSHFKR